MRIAMVVTPLNRSNLRLAAQIGVTDIVARYPGSNLRDLLDIRDQTEEFRLKLSVVEGYLPMREIVAGSAGRDVELEQILRLIEAMGKARVGVLCYNFMQTGDMMRTKWDATDRAGALVNSFDAELLKDQPPLESAISDPQRKWDNLAWFLERVLPACEKANVKLAMHPDDPPMSPLLGEARIMSSVADFERLVKMSDSAANGICFCGGCFSEMGADVPGSIRLFGSRIAYAHFRDVAGCVPKFRETFHDIGQTNMAAAMKAYKDIGFKGVMRPDHVPRMEGEQGDASGYSMLGRLFAVGYMRGLMHAVEELS